MKNKNNAMTPLKENIFKQVSCVNLLIVLKVQELYLLSYYQSCFELLQGLSVQNDLGMELWTFHLHLIKPVVLTVMFNYVVFCNSIIFFLILHSTCPTVVIFMYYVKSFHPMYTQCLYEYTHHVRLACLFVSFSNYCM